MCKLVAFCFLLVTTLAGCSSIESNSNLYKAASNALRDESKPSTDIGLWVRIGNLPAQIVKPGSCGLFLWATMPKRTLVFFSDNQTSDSALMFNGEQKTLPLTQANGQAILGHYSQQTYKNEALTVMVSFEAEIKEGLRDGAVIREGTWRIQEKSGWEIIMPVVGLIGCN